MKTSFLTIIAAFALVASFEVVGVSAATGGCSPKGRRGLRGGDVDSDRKLDDCRERKRRALLKAQKVAAEAKEGKGPKTTPDMKKITAKEKEALLDVFEDKNE